MKAMKQTVFATTERNEARFDMRGFRMSCCRMHRRVKKRG